mgnify:CR=1 FL=1
MRKAIIAILPAVVLALLVCGCSKSPEPPAEPVAEVIQESAVDATLVDDAAMSDETTGENWLAFGRTYSEQRFSPLDRINDVNVSGLGVDWYLDLPEDRGLVSTPLVVDGVLYFIGSMNRVRAVDATNGELLWQFDPEVVENTGNDPDDTFEAVVAAVFLDGGFNAAYRIIDIHLTPLLEQIHTLSSSQDFKSQLQELVQAGGEGFLGHQE